MKNIVRFWSLFGGLLICGHISLLCSCNRKSDAAETASSKSEKHEVAKTTVETAVGSKGDQVLQSFRTGRYGRQDGDRVSTIEFFTDLRCCTKLNTNFGYIEKYGRWTTGGSYVIAEWNIIQSPNQSVIPAEVGIIPKTIELEFGRDDGDDYYVKIGDTKYWAKLKDTAPIGEELKQKIAQERRDQEEEKKLLAIPREIVRVDVDPNTFAVPENAENTLSAIEMLGGEIRPTGSGAFGREHYLLFGEKLQRVGDRITVSHKGVDHEFEIVSIGATRFRIRYNNNEWTKSIK